MAGQPEFVRRQYAFAAHIRDPEHCPAPPDVEDRRMAIYRELFYNNVESFLSGTFPVLRKIHGDDAWHALARAFFAAHRSHSPLFLDIPREFLTWLREERTPRAGDYPFLYELAHYEWVELALSVAEEDIDLQDIDPDGDLLEGTPALSPLVWQLAYDYPVHRIGPDFIPAADARQPTWLVVYRTRDDTVGFMEINPVTKRLLELLAADTGATGRRMLEQIATELAHPQPEVVIRGGHDILRNLLARDIVTGTRTAAG
ncbi:MAG: putative DNA-binding domain-containing protein [Pseudomonadota bacterium]